MYWTRKRRRKEGNFPLIVVYLYSECRNWELTAAWTNGQIKVPVKFIVGDLDITYNAPGTKDFLHNGGMKKYVPLLEEIVVLKDVGHFLHKEKPDEINTHILQFFRNFRNVSSL